MDSKALHRRIEEDIARRILSGEWKPGHRLPTEGDLVAQYGCARMTASKAMSGLALRGLITRRRRIGSIVAHPPLHSAAVVSVPDIRSEIEARGQSYGHRLLMRQVRKVSPVEAWLDDAGRVVHLETLHFADGVPFALELRLIALAAVPEAERADFNAEPPGSWLLAQTPWTEAEHRISAVTADSAIARHLRLPLATACLRLERRTWRNGIGVTWAFQTFPGPTYDLIARFQPSKA